MVSEASFKRTLGQWPSGVCIVTSRGSDGHAGMTVSAFISVSLEPPLVGVCLDNRSHTLRAIKEVSRFGVNILSEQQAQLSNLFAVTGNEATRFDGLVLRTVPGAESPLIEGAAAHIDCEIFAMHLAGDHTLCIGRLRFADSSESRPLLFHKGAYHQLAPLGGGEAGS